MRSQRDRERVKMKLKPHRVVLRPENFRPGGVLHIDRHGNRVEPIKPPKGQEGAKMTKKEIQEKSKEITEQVERMFLVPVHCIGVRPDAETATQGIFKNITTNRPDRPDADSDQSGH